MSLRPDVVRRAIELGVITRAEAPRFLRDDPPTPRPLHITPRVAPPPERLRLVTRPDGRTRRVRARLTAALAAAGIIDADAIKGRHTPPAPPGKEHAS